MMKDKVVIKKTEGREELFDLFCQVSKKVLSEESEEKAQESKLKVLH